MEKCCAASRETQFLFWDFSSLPCTKNLLLSFWPSVLMISWIDWFILSVVSLTAFHYRHCTFFNSKFHSHILTAYSYRFCQISGMFHCLIVRIFFFYLRPCYNYSFSTFSTCLSVGSRWNDPFVQYSANIQTNELNIFIRKHVWLECPLPFIIKIFESF